MIVRILVAVLAGLLARWLSGMLIKDQNSEIPTVIGILVGVLVFLAKAPLI